MTAVFFIAAGMLLLAISSWGGKKRTVREPYRIDRPHVVDPDDYECSVCHRRFQRNQMSCPYCGVRFTDWVTDEDEFTFEEDELEDWDEEDGL